MERTPKERKRGLGEEFWASLLADASRGETRERRRGRLESINDRPTLKTTLHPVCSMGHLDCKDNGFVSSPDLTPSHDEQRSSLLSHGSVTGPNCQNPAGCTSSRTLEELCAGCCCWFMFYFWKKKSGSFRKTWKFESEFTPNSLFRIHSKFSPSSL